MPKKVERYWVCNNCGMEYHGYPPNMSPYKCKKCGGVEFTKMVRETVPLDEWKPEEEG
jgi:PHP family Zn ribbon phosphoesterase